MSGSKRRSLLGRDRKPRLGGRLYLAYCFACLGLTIVLVAAVVWEVYAPIEDAQLWRERLQPWESGVEALMGFSLCFETMFSLRSLGKTRPSPDRWRALDVMITGLAIFCGGILALIRLATGGDRPGAGATPCPRDTGAGLVDTSAWPAMNMSAREGGFLAKQMEGTTVWVVMVLERSYLPLLVLCFALKAFRTMHSMPPATLARKLSARKFPTVGIQFVPELPRQIVDPRKPCQGLARPVLTPEVVCRLREFLPCYLRFAEWELAYSPAVHGTSLNTFYRQQAGPNLIVIEDAQGGIFGAFVLSPWHITRGSYGKPESFVFVVRQGATVSSASHSEAAERDLEQDIGTYRQSMNLDEPTIDVFWANPGQGRVMQWSDKKMFGVGGALVVCDDFLHGSTSSCGTFGSGPLSPHGKDFVIRSLECWHIGTHDAV